MNGYIRGLEAVTARRQRARREAARLVHRGLDVTSFARAVSSSVAHAVPCEGDLVCHLVIDAQDVLITLVTPAETEPTCGAVIYWDVAETPPTGDDPLDALTVRPAAAYEEPRLLRPSR
jgi:hypothetical protein